MELRSLLLGAGATIIEGPRACGKTSTARQVAASEVLLDVDENARAAVNVDPNLLLQGAVPRLIDEWQIEPQIWNHVRREVDKRGAPGQFILTGSSVPPDDITRHTGAGRILRLLMRPMTLFESGHSTGEISLRGILNGVHSRSTDSGLSVLDLADRIAVGGWPGLIDTDVKHALPIVRGYIAEIQRSDISRVDQTKRDPNKVGRLLRSLARNISTTATITTLTKDASGPASKIKADTVREYLDSLERLMIVEDLPGWEVDLRSRSRVRMAAKRHFVDPSLAVAALRATPERIVNDLRLMGFLFESLAVRDLRVYAQASDALVFHYRDNTGLEVDAIVENADGNWAAFEIKLGHGYIDDAAKSLKKFAKRVNMESNTSLSIIVSTGLGYTREDGINVIPIGSLGP